MAHRAAFFDIDGTLTSDNVWKGIMDFFKRRGVRRLEHYFFSGVHYPIYFLRRAHIVSESFFRKQWGGHLPWYFHGYDDAQMTELANWVAHECVSAVARQEVLAKLREHLAAQDVVALVSGAPTPIVQAIANMWQVPHPIGSPAEKRAGRYTGGMTGAPCIDEQKAIYIRQYFAAQNLELDLAQSFAYADSFSDLGMFEMVGHPVAVYPDEKLALLAQAKGWQIIGATVKK